VTFLLKSEAAKELRESVRELERQIAAGEIAVHRIGRRVLIARSDLDAFLKGHREEARTIEDVRTRLARIGAAALAKQKRSA
jgi:excisionase family DNA binding protein